MLYKIFNLFNQKWIFTEICIQYFLSSHARLALRLVLPLALRPSLYANTFSLDQANARR